jgi:hypothetical protein
VKICETRLKIRPVLTHRELKSRWAFKNLYGI